MIEIIMTNKIIAILSILIALVMIAHSIVSPSSGVMAITVLATSYAGLIGIPTLLRRK